MAYSRLSFIRKKRWSALAVTAIVVFGMQSTDGIANKTNSCVNSEASVQQTVHCLAATKLSWGSWLTGHSRSAQFHFLDLLELLRNNQSEMQ